MTGRAALLARWSRRDWLAVAVIAVTAAFLVGTLLMLLTVSAYTETIEGELDRSGTVTHYDSLSQAQSAAQDRAIVLPLSRVETTAGQRRIVGVPADAPLVLTGASVAWKDARLPRPPPGTVFSPVGVVEDARLEGPSGTTTVSVRNHPDGDSLFPDRWLVAHPTTVEILGTTGAFVINPAAPPLKSGPAAVPLLNALPFLIAGIRDVLRTLSIGTLASGLLVGIVVYSVTRMTIQDRLTTIRVYRSTGGDPVDLLGLLGLRAFAVTTTGVVIGYAMGVVATNAVVNVAVTLGIPVNLATVVTIDIAKVLGLTGGLLVIAGTGAGLIAAWPTIRRSPGSLGRDTARSAGASSLTLAGLRLRPRFLSLRASLSVGGALTVFVLIVLLLGSFVGAFAPGSQTSGGTVVEAGASHPLNSRVDPSIAYTLRKQGVAASPEVLLAQVRGGRAYLVRGANYSSFRRVRDVSMLRGHTPTGTDEAAIGADLARTLGVSVGDRLTLGGSVSPGVRRVTVVGRFQATGITDDQLVVPLETAAPLATGGDAVHVIRTNASVNFASADTSIVVTGVTAPSRVPRGEPVTVTVTVQNMGAEPAAETLTLHAGSDTEQVSVRLEPAERTTITRTYRFTRTGSHTVGVAPSLRTVEVTQENTFVFADSFPDRSPPGATLIVPALTTNGTTVQGATVSIGSLSTQTTERGTASIPVPDEPGTYTITVEKTGYSAATHQLTVEPGVQRHIGGRITVTPKEGTPVTRPTVTVHVVNPWGRIQTRNVTLITATQQETRTVRLTAGNVTRLMLNASQVGFDRDLPPSSYQLALRADGRLLATSTYVVRGDARVAATMGGEGAYAAGSDVDRAIRNVFGNIEVVFVTMLLLAGLAAGGGTTATFAAAVHGRRPTVGVLRATGATPRQVLSVIVGDAMRVAVPATLLGLLTGGGIVIGLDMLGVLVVFGVDLTVPDSPVLAAGLLVGSFVLAATTAALSSWIAIRQTPASLLSTK